METRFSCSRSLLLLFLFLVLLLAEVEQQHDANISPPSFPFTFPFFLLLPKINSYLFPIHPFILPSTHYSIIYHWSLSFTRWSRNPKTRGYAIWVLKIFIIYGISEFWGFKILIFGGVLCIGSFGSGRNVWCWYCPSGFQMLWFSRDNGCDEMGVCIDKSFDASFVSCLIFLKFTEEMFN